MHANDLINNPKSFFTTLPFKAVACKHQGNSCWLHEENKGSATQQKCRASRRAWWQHRQGSRRAGFPLKLFVFQYFLSYKTLCWNHLGGTLLSGCREQVSLPHWCQCPRRPAACGQPRAITPTEMPARASKEPFLKNKILKARRVKASVWPVFPQMMATVRVLQIKRARRQAYSKHIPVCLSINFKPI